MDSRLSNIPVWVTENTPEFTPKDITFNTTDIPYGVILSIDEVNFTEMDAEAENRMTEVE